MSRAKIRADGKAAMTGKNIVEKVDSSAGLVDVTTCKSWPYPDQTFMTGWGNHG